MVALLALAHEQACEAELGAELEAILDRGGTPDLAALRLRFSRKLYELPPVAVVLPALAMYDALLGAECMEVPA